MKELVEEYGMLAVAVLALGVLIGLIPRLRYGYLLVEQLFLGGIGG
ncbi:MAG: hypothetical protein K2M46_06475 [Lachnospiraceae bacterium]|nr:hypothetical protein [Lachnospiraceae bacterium]